MTIEANENQDEKPMSTQEVVRAAFEKSKEEESIVDQDALSEEEVAPIEEEEKPLSEAQAKRVRDESGKFKKKDVDAVNEPPVTSSANETTPASGPIQLTTEKPPSSWSPTAREHWKDLPEDVKKDIIRREQDSANRHMTLEKEYAPVKTFLQHVEPHVQELQRRGLAVGPHVAAILQTERGLMAQELPTRFQTLLQIADAYQIPLRKIINQAVGVEVLGNPSQPTMDPAIVREIEGIKQWRSDMEQQTVNAQVDAWGADKDFYLDVAPKMADLLHIGAATSLEDAYEQACFMNPEIRKVILDRQSKEQKDLILASKQKVAAKASIAGKGKVSVDLEGEEPTDTLSVVRRAVASAKNQRL